VAVTDEGTPASGQRWRRWLRLTVTGLGIVLFAVGAVMLVATVDDDKGRSCGSSPAIIEVFDDDGRGEPGRAAVCRANARDQVESGVLSGSVGGVLALGGLGTRARRWAGEGLAADGPGQRLRRWLRLTLTGFGVVLFAGGALTLLAPAEDDEGRSCGSTPAIIRVFDDDGRGEPGWAAACRTNARDQVVASLPFAIVGGVLALRGRISRAWRRAGAELAAERPAAETAAVPPEDVGPPQHPHRSGR
jgi:hypothetical protein